MTRAYCVRTMLVVLVCVFGVLGQTPPANLPNQTLLVSIPVTVTNQNGAHFAGLNAASFSLSENYQNRVLESVQEVAPVTFGKMNDKVLFLVLDAISMSRGQEDIGAETRKECLQLLASATTTGARISLSELDRDGLHVIHEVSTPSSVLASALLQLDDEQHFLVDRDQLQAMKIAAEDKSLLVAEADHLRRFRHLAREGFTGATEILLIQLKAFQQMAGALRRAQGRKTVIWLTTGITLFGRGEAPDFTPIPEGIDYQRTVNLLNNAHISIFPTQIRVAVTGFGLWQVAQSTGGSILAFDAPDELLKHAEDLSTSYCLLAFHPETITTGIRWNKLKVRLNDQSLRARSPNGLFVFPPTK